MTYVVTQMAFQIFRQNHIHKMLKRYQEAARTFLIGQFSFPNEHFCGIQYNHLYKENDTRLDIM